jgi:NAD(P)-dependent dehydrogenase (short-subunit alcohol dehydrogenase family)
MQSFQLEGKKVVLTGAGGILGSRITAELLEQGAQVVAIDRDMNTLIALREANQCSPALHVHAVDICNHNALKQLSTSVGDVDVLINNAATKSPHFFNSFETFPVEDWQQVMNVNVTGAMHCCQLFGGAMAKAGKGSIINVLSIYGVVAPDQRIYEGSEYLGKAINTPAVYSVSKAALWGLTHHLAAYWGHCGVRVNAVTPGGIFSGQNQTFVDRYSARVPLGRMGQKDELLGAFLFLASDLSSYITGQNIIVDGGLTVW